MNHKSWVDSVKGREVEMKKGGHPGGFSIDNISSNNKRKIHDEILEEGLPVPKHVCLDNKDHRPLFQIQDTTTTTCFMSQSYDSKHDHDVSSSSSVNWSGATTLPDSVYQFDYPSPSFDQESPLDCVMSIPEYYKTSHQIQDHGDGDGGLMFCSNAGEEASSTNYVLSSGRWNVVNNQDTEQIGEKLTIDKEFEQYFSMLML
uniref:protein FAR-RED-ELONGATED HYPOCOTYL 1-LIKE-like n=1 Tax=Erigeron canadensis TaxID=72917 RepID=UPI001CB8C8F2|nr:protein FAR-RED-ELONGATED HYPOCOTYL 1-LIKE-like [Erigeron canadensis]XP_043628885.1 protein FAR-RED-ELONGATED HYPOCOTYL 1-LIKE-like [Erigeron canadensis]